MISPIRTLAAVAMCLGVAAPVSATPLPPGGSVTPATTTYNVAKGSVLAAATINYTLGPGMNGTLREEVVKESSGKLDFLYQFTQTGKASVTMSTGSSFKGAALDVFQAKTITGAGVKFNAGSSKVSTESRSADGSTLSFTFSPPVKNSMASYIQILKTNALKFTTGTFTVTGSNGASTTITGLFVPIAVPEPATIVMWCALFGGLVLAATRKNWKRLLISQPVS